MQNVAQAWLVYRLTHSSMMLGVVAFCNLAPVLFFSLVAGVLADRMSRWKLLVLANTLAALQALTLGVLTLGGWVRPWHIIGLALLIGVIHALEMPARHSFVPEMVPREDLSNAIALNSSAFNVARFLGPSVAGLLVALWGEGWVFMINSLSFGAILLALLRMRLTPRVRQMAHGSMRKQLGEGIRYAWEQRHVRAGLLLIAIISLVAASTTVLMPVFAKQIFSGGSEIMGAMLGAMGIGSLLGALTLARRRRSDRQNRLIGLAGIVAGLALLAFSLSHTLLFALPILAVVGYCQTTLVASTNTLIQLLVPDILRGRVMSLFSMIFIGLMPIGSLTAGIIAQYWGATWSVRLFAALCVLGAAVFLLRAGRTGDVDPRDGGNALTPRSD